MQEVLSNGKTKSIFDFDEDKLGEYGKASARAYHAIYDGLSEEKTFCIDQMCNMFKTANAAYHAISGIGKYYNAVSGMCEAGANASQFEIHMNILLEKYGCTVDELDKKIDATSEWLKERGWFGIPEPYDKDGHKHIKTAYAMRADMEKYIKTYTDMLAAIRQANEEKEFSKHVKVMKEA